MKILYLPRFARQYKKLPSEIKVLAEKKEAIFRKNPFDPKLKTHKLKGELKDFYSFLISFSCRIIFDFADKKTVRFYAVGDHDVYR